jgi:hypothetical protein
MKRPPKPRPPTELLETTQIWRDDAIIHPDGTRERGWVTLRRSAAEPYDRDEYISTKQSYKLELTHEDAERFADLYERLVITGGDDDDE